MSDTPKDNEKIITNSDKQNDGRHIICRPWIILRNGKRLYASSLGKKAFCFPVDDDRQE